MHYCQCVHSPSISRVRTRYKDWPKTRDEHIRRSGLLAEHTHIWSAHTHIWSAHTHIWSAHTHIWSAHTHRQPRQLCVNTELSSPPLFWAWMNKFRQNYIKMHVLDNILIKSRLRKACLNVNSGEKRHVYQFIKSVLSFIKWKKTNNKYNAVKEKYKCSLLLTK